MKRLVAITTAIMAVLMLSVMSFAAGGTDLPGIQLQNDSAGWTRNQGDTEHMIVASSPAITLPAIQLANDSAGWKENRSNSEGMVAASGSSVDLPVFQLYYGVAPEWGGTQRSPEKAIAADPSDSSAALNVGM